MSSDRKPNDNARQNVDRLVREHAETLYAYALMRVGRPEPAEDMVQETLLAALQGWDQFAGHSSERTWLIGILRHKILDFFRRHHGPEPPDDETGQTEYFDRHGHWREHPSSWQADPLALAENREFRQILQGCLQELSRIMAEAFVMRELEGMSCEEVCKHLQISETNLWVRLHRARLQLRRCLELNWFAR